jgi:hypothetical protein
MWPPIVTNVIQCLQECSPPILSIAKDTDSLGNIQTLDNVYITHDKSWICFLIVDRQKDVYIPSTILYLRYSKLLLNSSFLNTLTDFHKVHHTILHGDGWPEIEKMHSYLIYSEKNNVFYPEINTEKRKNIRKRKTESTEKDEIEVKVNKNIQKFTFRDTPLSTWQSNIRDSLIEFLHVYISPSYDSYKILAWIFLECLYYDSYCVLRQSPIYPIDVTVRLYCEHIVKKLNNDEEMIIEICENKSNIMFDNPTKITEYDDFVICNHGDCTNKIHFKCNISRPYTNNKLPFLGCFFLFLMNQNISIPIQLSETVLELFLQEEFFVKLSYSKDSAKHYKYFINGLAIATKQNTNDRPFSVFQDIMQLKKNIYYDKKKRTYELKPSLIFENNKSIYVIKDDVTNNILYRYTDLVEPPLTKNFIINDQFRKIITLSKVGDESDASQLVNKNVIDLCAAEANITYAKTMLLLCNKNIDINISELLVEDFNSAVVNDYVNISKVSKIIDQAYYKYIIKKNPNQLIEIGTIKLLFIDNRFIHIDENIIFEQKVLAELNNELYLKIINGDISDFTLQSIFDFDLKYFPVISKAVSITSNTKSAIDMLEIIYYVKQNMDTNLLLYFLISNLKNKQALLYTNNTPISLYQFLHGLLHKKYITKNILSFGNYIYFQHDSGLLLYTFKESDYIQEATLAQTMINEHKYFDFIDLIVQKSSLNNIDQKMIQKTIYDWMPSFIKEKHHSFMNQLLENLDYYLVLIWNISILSYNSIILLNIKAEEALIQILINKVIKKVKNNQLNLTDELIKHFPNQRCAKNAIHLSSEDNELMCILHSALYTYNSLEDYLVQKWIKTQLIGFCFLKQNPDNHFILIVMHSNINPNISKDFNIHKLINSNYNIHNNIKNHYFIKHMEEILYNHNVQNIADFTHYLTKIWNTNDKYTDLKISLNVPFSPNSLKDFKDYIRLDKSNNDMVFISKIHKQTFQDLFHYYSGSH